MNRDTKFFFLALTLAVAAPGVQAHKNGSQDANKALDAACAKIRNEKRAAQAFGSAASEAPRPPSKAIETKCRQRRAELKEASRKEKAAQAARRKQLKESKEKMAAQVPAAVAKDPSDTLAQSNFFDLGGLSDGGAAALPSAAVASPENRRADAATEMAKPRASLPTDFRSQAPPPPAPGTAGAPPAIINAALAAFYGGNALVRRGGMAIDTDGDLSNGDKGLAAVARRDPHRQAQTALTFSNGRSLDPTRVPYVVIPGGDRSARLGDLVLVEYQGRRTMAIVGDVGPRNKFGEGSMALARSLGINPDGVRGGVDSGVTYTFLGRGVGRSPRGEAEVVAALQQSETAMLAGR